MPLQHEPYSQKAVHHGLREAIDRLEIALPPASAIMDQDEEWVVVRKGREWKKIRLHDYAEVFEVPGLYEKWVYEIFECRSPARVREMLARHLREDGIEANTLSVLDLGAGNGCVAQELSDLGAEELVGVDIHPEAAEAAERDRPGLYDDYVVGDLLNLPEPKRERLEERSFNCLTCVAALGFGDIPAEVFTEAYNLIEDGGLVAFTIKDRFVETSSDKSGFARTIRRLIDTAKMEMLERDRFVHRVNASGEPLEYDAIIGRKLDDAPAA